LQDHAIGSFDLAVSSRVSYCEPVPVTEVQEFFAGELRAIVGDNDVGYPELVNDVDEDEDSLFGANICDGSSLDPFGEFVDGY